MPMANSMVGFSKNPSNLVVEAEGEVEVLEVEGGVQEEVDAPANRSYRGHAPTGNRERMSIPVMMAPSSM